MVWKTMDGFRVPQQTYPHFFNLVLKNFVHLISVVVGHRQNIFNHENFLIYGTLKFSCDQLIVIQFWIIRFTLHTSISYLSTIIFLHHSKLSELKKM